MITQSTTVGAHAEKNAYGTGKPSAADDPPQAGPGTSDERPAMRQGEAGRPIEQTDEDGAAPRRRVGRGLPLLGGRALGRRERLDDATRSGLGPHLKAARGEHLHAAHARGVRLVTFAPEIAHANVRATVRPHEGACVTRQILRRAPKEMTKERFIFRGVSPTKYLAILGKGQFIRRPANPGFCRAKRRRGGGGRAPSRPGAGRTSKAFGRAHRGRRSPPGRTASRCHASE